MFSEFPAPAGINRWGWGSVIRLLRVPRASGDKPSKPVDYRQGY